MAPRSSCSSASAVAASQWPRRSATGSTSSSAALDALLDYGRPRTVELAVLVDRGGRELPIFASYAAKSLEVPADQRVDVLTDATGLRAVLQAAGAPSVPPSAMP